MAQIIKADGTVEETEPANGIDFTLAEMKAVIGGGYIEIFNLSDGRLMVLDDEGKLKRFPRNPKATEMARDRLMPGDFICGDVLVCDNNQID